MGIVDQVPSRLRRSNTANMNSFLVFAALVAVASAAPQLFPTMKSMVMTSASLEHHGMAHGAKPMAKEGGAEVTDYAFDMPEPGRYLYHFKTNNGIAMMEQAAHEKDSAKVQGAYEWTSPEGGHYKLEYVADELGFHPQAAHLPVAPAVPEDIMRSLQWNAAHPEEAKETDMYAAKGIMH